MICNHTSKRYTCLGEAVCDRCADWLAKYGYIVEEIKIDYFADCVKIPAMQIPHFTLEQLRDSSA